MSYTDNPNNTNDFTSDNYETDLGLDSDRNGYTEQHEEIHQHEHEHTEQQEQEQEQSEQPQIDPEQQQQDQSEQVQTDPEQQQQQIQNRDDITEPIHFRKLFIGSLSYSTNEEGMREYFGQFGEILDCVIMKEPKTNKSRGFGFVTYAKSSMIDEVMKHRPHKLDGRDLETKRATPREEAGKPGAELSTKKLFVGAIKEGLIEDHLRQYFAPYGNITDCVIMREKDTNKLRGFGFVTFDDYDPVDKIVLEKVHTINGQSVAVKKALPKDSGSGGRGYRGRDNYNDNADYSESAGNIGMGNFAMMAQKMFEAASLQNFRGNKRMGGAPQRQLMNFAADDFEGYEGFGNRSGGGPMRNRQGGRSGGPYGGGYGRPKN